MQPPLHVARLVVTASLSATAVCCAVDADPPQSPATALERPETDGRACDNHCSEPAPAEMPPGNPHVQAPASCADSASDRKWYGDFTITDWTDRENLSAFDCVTGILTIDSSSIATLRGLERLRAIDGGIVVEDAPALASFEGLSHLRYLGGLVLSSPDTPSLGPLLDELPEIHGDVVVDRDARLSWLYLGGVEHVHGSLILRCNSLQHLDGLSRLREVDGDVTVLAEGLRQLDGLRNVRRIGGSLEARSLPNLERLGLLSNLREVGGDLYLASLSHTNVVALEALQSIGGDLTISHCDALADLDGFQHLNSVGGVVAVRENNTLADISGLAGLASVGVVTEPRCEYNCKYDLVDRSFRVRSNPALPTYHIQQVLGGYGAAALVEGNRFTSSRKYEHPCRVEYRFSIYRDSFEGFMTNVFFEFDPDGVPLVEHRNHDRGSDWSDSSYVRLSHDPVTGRREVSYERHDAQSLEPDHQRFFDTSSWPGEDREEEVDSAWVSYLYEYDQHGNLLEEREEVQYEGAWFEELPNTSIRYFYDCWDSAEE